MEVVELKLEVVIEVVVLGNIILVDVDVVIRLLVVVDVF